MRQIIVVAGPTAVGKTKYAIAIAKAVGGEIVSCDSMQLYKYMNIGSAKPTAGEQREVKHYLVDEIDPREPFSVAKYRALAKQAIEEIFRSGKVPVISGGTGLYLNALLYEMDFSNAPQDTALRKNLEEEAEVHKEEFGYITVIENVFGFKQVLPLQEGDNVIGRRCVGTVINTPIESGDMSMDRRHCIINVKRNKQGKLVYTLRDAPSLTGTFLMNEILGDKDRVRMEDGAIVTIGATTFILHTAEAE